jgi:hypothetical protein
MPALNHTIWTWDAIGNRRGLGAVPIAPETNKGFLLNHLIHELPPLNRMACGGAIPTRSPDKLAWFDLKVKVEKSPRLRI